MQKLECFEALPLLPLLPLLPPLLPLPLPLLFRLFSLLSLFSFLPLLAHSLLSECLSELDAHPYTVGSTASYPSFPLALPHRRRLWVESWGGGLSTVQCYCRKL